MLANALASGSEEGRLAFLGSTLLRSWDRLGHDEPINPCGQLSQDDPINPCRHLEGESQDALGSPAAPYCLGSSRRHDGCRVASASPVVLMDLGEMSTEFVWKGPIGDADPDPSERSDPDPDPDPSERSGLSVLSVPLGCITYTERFFSSFSATTIDSNQQHAASGECMELCTARLLWLWWLGGPPLVA